MLLLDEPLGALDLKLREAMQIELKGLQRELGITFVFVTHDQGEALSMSDRVAVFDRGRIVQVDTPRGLYRRPRNPFVAEFVGGANVLPATLAQTLLGRCQAGRDSSRADADPARPARRRSPAGLPARARSRTASITAQRCACRCARPTANC